MYGMKVSDDMKKALQETLEKQAVLDKFKTKTIRDKLLKTNIAIIKAQVASESRNVELKNDLLGAKEAKEKLETKLSKLLQEHSSVTTKYHEEMRTREEILKKLTTTHNMCAVLDLDMQLIRSTQETNKLDCLELTDKYHRAEEHMLKANQEEKIRTSLAEKTAREAQERAIRSELLSEQQEVTLKEKDKEIMQLREKLQQARKEIAARDDRLAVLTAELKRKSSAAAAPAVIVNTASASEVTRIIADTYSKITATVEGHERAHTYKRQKLEALLKSFGELKDCLQKTCNDSAQAAPATSSQSNEMPEPEAEPATEPEPVSPILYTKAERRRKRKLTDI